MISLPGCNLDAISDLGVIGGQAMTPAMSDSQFVLKDASLM